MTSYHSFGGQLEKLSRAYKNNSAITIRLTKNELSGPHELMMTKIQINKIKESMKNGVGTDIEIRKTQIKKSVEYGGSLWGSFMNLGSRLLPMAIPLAKKAIARIAAGALSGLVSLGVDKIFGKGQRGGFMMPQNKIDQLIKYKNLLTAGQKKQILEALQTGGQLVINQQQNKVEMPLVLFRQVLVCL